MMKRLAWFLAGAILLWAGLVLGLRGRDFAPDTAVITVAAGLCLVPSLLALAWASWSVGQTPEQQLLATLGGTGVRMFIVLAVGLVLTSTVPYFAERQQGFWISVLVFYLLYLALEVAILLIGRPFSREPLASAEATRSPEARG
jgi:hypothetical protein